MPRIQDMNRRTIWYGVKVMARTHILTSSRPGTLVSPTSSIGMRNEKNGEEVMSCTLECNPCNSLTVTGEEGWKSKKNTPVRESCSAYLETHFHFNSMCLFYIKWHVWQTLEGNTFWALSVLTIDEVILKGPQRHLASVTLVFILVGTREKSTSKWQSELGSCLNDVRGDLFTTWPSYWACMKMISPERIEQLIITHRQAFHRNNSRAQNKECLHPNADSWKRPLSPESQGLFLMLKENKKALYNVKIRKPHHVLCNSCCDPCQSPPG